MLHDQLYRMGCDYVKRTDVREEPRKVLSLMTARPPVGLYFDESTQDNTDLCVTACEFLKAGLLPMPFGTITVSAPNFYEKMEAVYESGDDIDRSLNIWAAEVDLHEDGVKAGKQIAIVPFRVTRKGPEPSAWVILLDANDTSFMMMDYMKDIKKPLSKEGDLLSGEMYVYGFLQCLLMFNHPVYDKTETRTDEKQNRKREAKGKARLNPYIYIRMKKEIREGLAAGSGKPRKPHWRRGHLRNLGDGRIVPVQPCLVNWEGDPTEIAKKTYVYKKEKNA